MILIIVVIITLIYLISLGIFIYNLKNKKINEIEKWVFIFIFSISIVISLIFLITQKLDIDKRILASQQTAMISDMGEVIGGFVVFGIPLLLTILIINIICAVVKNVKLRWTINITFIIIIIVIETFCWLSVNTLYFHPTI